MKLYPHQADGIAIATRRLREDRGFYLNWEPGCGKTLGAIEIAKKLGVRKIAVIGPVAALGVWMREIARWDSAHVIVYRRDGMRAQKAQGPAERGYIVTNYDQIRATYTTDKQTGEIIVNEKSRSVLKRLIDWKPELLILDEAQNAKSPSSGNTQAVRELRAISTYVLLLSGTPAHSPLDWHPQYRLIDTNLYPFNQSFTKYKEWITFRHPQIRYAIDRTRGERGFRPECKAVAMEAMAPYTHTATAEELKVERPITQPIPFTLDTTELRVYREMEEHLLAELPGGGYVDAPIPLVKALRLHQITGGFVPNEDGVVKKIGNSKLGVTADLLDGHKHQKIIVAANFLAEIEAIGNLVGYREGALDWGEPVALTITGATSAAERSRIEQLFQTHDGPLVLILQYKAGGVALTLTAASALIIYSMAPSVIAIKQMLGRVYRIGQTKPVLIHPVLAEGSIDEDMWHGLLKGLEGVDLAAYLTRRLKEKRDG